MAADLKISHGRIGNEVNKVLSGKEVQAACYRCHELQPLKGAEGPYAGFRLFFDNACGLCHRTGATGTAGYGPDLSDAGSYLSLKQIRASIENPKEALENSIMPKFSLSPEETTSIAYFLKSRIKDPYYETPMTRLATQRKAEIGQEPTTRAKVLKGAELLKEKKCLACHKFDESDGQIGPDLTYIAYMRGSEYIETFLKNPGREIPGAIMPISPATREEESQIVRFLATRRHVHLHGGNADKNIYMMLCQRCHAAQGDGFGTIQPNLAGFPRPFRGNREFFRMIPDERITRSIEQGVPGTSMPPYGELFDRATVNSVIDLLFRAFIRANRADKKIPGSPPKPAVLPKAEAMTSTFEKKCAQCHGVHGTGKGPEYLKYLPRPRDLTNRPYLNALTEEQIAAIIGSGVPGTGMAAFSHSIPPESVWGLVGIVRAFSQGLGPYDDGR
jgi:cytochrome c2